MSGWCNDDQFVVPAYSGDQIFIVNGPLNNTNINLIVFNHVQNALGVGHVQAHRNIREFDLVLTQNTGDHILPYRRTCPENKRPKNVTRELSDLVIHLTVK